MEIILKPYRAEDFAAVAALFCQTISSVNARDYSPFQCDAWVRRSQGLLKRKDALMTQRTILAEHRNLLVGFGSIDATGYLDLLYVHKDCLRRGIATTLCDELEKNFSVVTTHASVTAKPFFEQRGYLTEQKQEIDCGGVRLCNFVMKKEFTK